MITVKGNTVTFTDCATIEEENAAMKEMLVSLNEMIVTMKELIITQRNLLEYSGVLAEKSYGIDKIE